MKNEKFGTSPVKDAFFITSDIRRQIRFFSKRDLQMNKKGSRYRRLMEIRSSNSFRKYGWNPKEGVLMTDIHGEKRVTYKDQIVFMKGTQKALW